MGENPRVLSERLSAFLRRRVNAKGLAQAIDCDPRTAENLLSGTWPGARHWLGIVRTFGHDVTEAVFHPQDAVERLQREAEDLERRSAEKRAMAAEMARLSPRRKGAVAPTKDRAA